VITERPDLACDPGQARPAVVLRVEGLPGGPQRWTPVPHLMASGPFDQAVVVDVDERGRATLRPGDGEYGRELAGASRIVAYYRVGNGRDGNVGAEALAHLVLPAGALPAALRVARVRNPLAAEGGTDPETIEEVRQRAPAAFRSVMKRAVTAGDYRAAATGLAGVAGAAATFRWTGSWYAAQVAVDPARPEDLVTEPGGRTRLEAGFERSLRAGLGQYRLAGYDLALRTARYVPLRVELLVCVKPGHFRGDVARAVREALTGRGGLFDPARLGFGDAVYASRIYHRVEGVEGVDSVSLARLERLDRGAAGELDAGVLPIGPWEIARLDDDPNRMENGVLVIRTGGGK
jgi:predicted phage baseplate assembly protein